MSDRPERIRATVADRATLARVLAAALRRSLVTLHIDGVATHGVQILEILCPGLPTVGLLAEPTGDRSVSGITFRVVPGNPAHAAQLADFLASLNQEMLRDARARGRAGKTELTLGRNQPPDVHDEPRSISVQVSFDGGTHEAPPSSGTISFDDEASLEDASIQATSLFDPSPPPGVTSSSPATDDTLPAADQGAPSARERAGSPSTRERAASASSRGPASARSSRDRAGSPSSRDRAAPPSMREPVKTTPDDEPVSIPGTTVFDPDALLRAAPRQPSARPDDSVTDVIVHPPARRRVSSAPPTNVDPRRPIEEPAMGRLIGRTLAAGKYRLLESIGAGASGEVYRASHRDLDRNVAVKVLLSEWQMDPDSLTRFRTEARAASRLDHTNTMRVIDFGDEPDGLLYIVMELLLGRSLEQELARRTQIPVREAAHLMMQVCAALGAAHAKGIVHRDVKPANVMIVEVEDDDGALHEIVKVCDFGIAKLQRYGEDPTMPSLSRGLAGTPEYMSPELVTTGTADARSDVYACGVMMFELVTGTCPIVGATPLLILANQVHQAPPRLSQVVHGVDPRFEQIVTRSLEKSPDARYASARVLRRALAEWLSDR